MTGVCEKEGVEAIRPEPGSKLGIAISTIGQEPINGLRHRDICHITAPDARRYPC